METWSEAETMAMHRANIQELLCTSARAVVARGMVVLAVAGNVQYTFAGVDRCEVERYGDIGEFTVGERYTRQAVMGLEEATCSTTG